MYYVKTVKNVICYNVICYMYVISAYASICMPRTWDIFHTPARMT
jgi:hypothetical protein